MKIKSNFLILFLALTICLFPVKSVFAGGSGGFSIGITDNAGRQLIGVFDLRDRETFLQITNIDSSA